MRKNWFVSAVYGMYGGRECQLGCALRRDAKGGRDTMGIWCAEQVREFRRALDVNRKKGENEGEEESRSPRRETGVGLERSQTPQCTNEVKEGVNQFTLKPTRGEGGVEKRRRGKNGFTARTGKRYFKAKFGGMCGVV